MSDPIAARIANLEAVVFAGLASPAGAQVVSSPGAETINVQNNLLVLITASGSVALNLAPPTSPQTNFVIVVISVNGFTNTINGGPFSGLGTPTKLTVCCRIPQALGIHANSLPSAARGS